MFGANTGGGMFGANTGGGTDCSFNQSMIEFEIVITTWTRGLVPPT